ncbi:plasmid mobilization relaxosome protein MobC [Afipia clevelandensis]|uniref:Bacterial mobilisation domain-containing protein n=1 Tax=Afipia clevelandensis ATCC 49720 TaxID=883079 RepID=K8P1P2_9BRAD|nr:plasmid mobilization relaxosome protein MobC [Afipia clevelandensis]EKS35361.1 hypothetical protein HMPREF9696_02633 [Afipia clevelandensis ATCC 49720]
MSGPGQSIDRSSPLSVRFTDAEKARLRDLAGSKPLGQYIRDRALNGHSEPRAARSSPIRDAEALGRLLGLLGQSRLSSNLNQLAKAANLGSLPVSAETEAELRQACADVLEMRQLLLRALGLQIINEAKSRLPVVEFFTEAAEGPAE